MLTRYIANELSLYALVSLYDHRAAYAVVRARSVYDE